MDILFGKGSLGNGAGNISRAFKETMEYWVVSVLTAMVMDSEYNGIGYNHF